jgi:hypothetical protein
MERKKNKITQLMERKKKEPSPMYIFPGLALGAALGQTGVLTDAMIQTAAEVHNY